MILTKIQARVEPQHWLAGLLSPLPTKPPGLSRDHKAYLSDFPVL